MENGAIGSKNHPWMRKNANKIAALFFWAAVLIAYQVYAQRNGLTSVQVVQQFLGLMSSRYLGPIIYILLYSIRPLLLFPSSILTLAGGFIFGPVLGVFYTILASNISATIAFFVGRYFGQGLIKEDSPGNLVQTYAGRLRLSNIHD